MPVGYPPGLGAIPGYLALDYSAMIFLLFSYGVKGR